MKRYIRAILSLASVGMLFYIIHDQRQQIKTLKTQHPVNVDSLHKVVDSLNDELFIWKTTVDRYDIGIERFKENHPDQAENIDEAFKNIE